MAQRAHIGEVGAKRWAEIKHKGEVIKSNAKERALHAAEVAKGQYTLHAKDNEEK